MRRKLFDSLATAFGGGLTIVLLVACGLLIWGYTFANNNVRDQLSAQQIYFPQAGSDALTSPQIGPYLNQYAGQKLTNGAQAKTYADHFIAVHLTEVADGKTYAQVSTAAQADPKNTTLQTQANTLFKGEALRSMLLQAYAFWKIGQIALYAGITSFILAGLMLLLTTFGLLHARRVDPNAELAPTPHKKTTTPTTATA